MLQTTGATAKTTTISTQYSNIKGTATKTLVARALATTITATQYYHNFLIRQSASKHLSSHRITLIDRFVNIYYMYVYVYDFIYIYMRYR